MKQIGYAVETWGLFFGGGDGKSRRGAPQLLRPTGELRLAYLLKNLGAQNKPENLGNI